MQTAELSRKYWDTTAALFTVAPLNSLSVTIMANILQAKREKKKSIEPEKCCAQTKLSIDDYTCA